MHAPQKCTRDPLMVQAIINGMWLLIRLDHARDRKAGNGGKKKQRTQ